MKKNLLCAALAAVFLLATGCTPAQISTTEVTQTGVSSGKTNESTAEPAETPASPTAEPTAAPEPTHEVEGKEEGFDATTEIHTMLPLLQARALVRLNGEDPDSASALWHAVAFAVNGCGLWFESAEAVGDTLDLPRSVVEDIASGLFYNFTALPNIPEIIGDEVIYRGETDTYAFRLSEIERPMEILSIEEAEDGSVNVSAALVPQEADLYAYDFSFVLLPKAEAGEAVFTYTIHSNDVELTELAGKNG